MADEQKIRKARSIIATAITELYDIENFAHKHADSDRAMQRLRQWMNGQCNFLAEHVSQDEADQLRSYQPNSWSLFYNLATAVSLVSRCRNFLYALDEQLGHYPDQ